MRGAGLPVEAMIEYVKLCQQGDSTIEARMLLLKEQMETLLEQKAQIESTIKRLDFKISRYEEAVKTGKLTWNKRIWNYFKIYYTIIIRRIYHEKEFWSKTIHLSTASIYDRNLR